jgi:hypothetical protein
MKLGDFLDRLGGAKVPKPAKKHDVEAVEEVRVPAARGFSLPLTKLAVAAAAIGVSFYLGMAYQQHQGSSSASTLGSNGNSSQNQNQTGMGGNFGGSNGFGGGSERFGGAGVSTSTVTAISSSSISLKDSSGNSSTYGITSDTLISDGGQQVGTDDIQTGDTVIVIPDREDTSTARRIIVNPDFGQNQNQSGDQPTQVDPEVN